VARLPRPTSPSFHIGKAVHEGVRRYHLSVWREENLTSDQIVEAYRTAFDTLEAEEEVTFKDGAQRETSLATGERVVRAYLESESAVLEAKPVGVEVRLEERIAGLPAPLYGIIDLVRPGNIPVDFKTAASTPSDLDLEAFQHEIQLVHYTLMLEEATGEAVTGTELIWLVKTKTPKVIRHVMPPPTPDQRHRFKALAGIFAEGVASERFHPQPGQHCSWCAYRTECREWTGGSR
jgi:putative RecB family exonuclease